MLKSGQNTALDIKILMYAYKHNGSQKDFAKLSKKLEIRSSEDFIRSLRYLEEEKFLVSDPQIWRLTAKGDATAFVIGSSRKNYLYLLLCLPLCVVIIFTIIIKIL